MTSIRVIMITLVGVLLAGCASVDVPTRALPSPGASSSDIAVMPTLNVKNVRVSVPKALEVSEANTYLPKGDIIWRGDAPGDRHAQVGAIFDTAMARGTASMKSGVPVTLDIQVTRFHALSDRTRQSVGGVHSIRFVLNVRDARTGELLRPAKMIQADINGYGGQAARRAELAGQTQKVRITDFLAGVIETELTNPNGFENNRLGLIQRLNHQAGTSS